MTTELEKLVADLTAWRARTKNCGRIPGNLKRTVLLLTQNYQLETLAAAVGLEKSFIQKWQRHVKDSVRQAPKKENSVDFVTLPIRQNAEPASLTLTLEFETGTRVLLSGQCRQELLELTRSLLRGVMA